MSGKSAISGELTKSYLEENPNAKSLTLARMMFMEHPQVWDSVEAARSSIRYYRGRRGAEYRKQVADKRFLLPDPTPGNPHSLPVPDVEEWDCYRVPDSCSKMLYVTDIHVPYHDMDAVSRAIDYGMKVGCDSVGFWGDIQDCYGISTFEKDPRKRRFAQEIEDTRHLFGAFRNAFPDAKMIYKEGNHEFRLPRYIQKKCPELSDADMIKPLDEILELDRLGIKWVDGKRPAFLNQLNLMHGDEYGGRSGGVNPARNMYLKTKECSIAGHWHRSSQYNAKTIRDRIISTWTVGCLCDMHPEYMPNNDWNHGFAIIEREDDDWFVVHNKRIINGKVV